MDEPLNKQITNLRKAGKLAEAWDIACPAVQDNPNDNYLKSAFFWLCYSYIKEVQTEIKDLATQKNGSHQPSDQHLERINFLLDWIVWLDIPPGGFEYRQLLISCQKNLEYLPTLVLLLMPLTANLFEDDDKKPYINENGESPSLMLKFSRAVAKSWLTQERVRQCSLEDVCTLLARVRKETTDKKNLIWLDYDEAKCLIIAKQFDQARRCILNVLRKKQTESWAWSALATTYREEDQSAATVLFCKALSCAREDTFALPILKNLAPLLANQNLNSEASICVSRAVKCYEENAWKIKEDLEELLKKPWYLENADKEAFPKFLETQSASALDFLFSEREKHVAVITKIHESGKGFQAYFNRDNHLPVRLGLYLSKQPPKPGNFILLTLSSEDQSIISAEPYAEQEIEDVSYEHGELRVNEKGFGFVNDTFVGNQLIENGMDGRNVKLMHFLDWNRKKEKHSWSAITIELME